MSGLLKPLYYEPARHLSRLAAERCYRTYVTLTSRLKRVPRFAERRVTVDGWRLVVPDTASFLSAYREIFVERSYAFRARTAEPHIVDLGANIGLSVLFFKQLYPAARIDAFEADPAIYRYLEQNVHGNGYGDVRLFNKAAWHTNTTLQFRSEGADGGRLASGAGDDLITVEAVDVAQFIGDRPIDLLKMDIEGAEVEVLLGCRERLHAIEHLFVEYHSLKGERQRLDELLGALRGAGFRYHIHSMLEASSPLVNTVEIAGYDMLLNIFAWREPRP